MFGVGTLWNLYCVYANAKKSLVSGNSKHPWLGGGGDVDPVISREDADEVSRYLVSRADNEIHGADEIEIEVYYTYPDISPSVMEASLEARCEASNVKFDKLTERGASFTKK